MAAFNPRQIVDLNSNGPEKITQAYGHVGDAKAHQWDVAIVRGGAPVDLTGYTVMALVNNGVGTVEIAGTISGNVATAIFPAACYTEGVHECFMRISKAADSSEAITALMHLNVTAGETDTPLDPGTDITATLSGALAQITACQEATAAANEAADYAIGIGAGLDARTGALETTAADHTSQLAEIGKVEATNMIVRGTGWTGNAGDIAVADNVITLTATDVQTYASIYKGSVAPTVGHKYYCAYPVKPFRTHYPLIYLGGVTARSAMIAPAGVYTRVSIVTGAAVSTDALIVYANGGAVDGMSVGSAVRYKDDFVLIDLTVVFGAGHEPTAAQMDAYLAYWTDAYFAGTINLAAAAKALPALIRAQKLLIVEDWIYPTLLNGWASVYGVAIGYWRDALGVVHFVGFVWGGASNSIAFVLPEGYRPATMLAFPCVGQTLGLASACEVYSDGSVYIKWSTSDAFISLSGVSFPTAG